MNESFIIYNDDGWSSYMRYPAPMSPEQVVAVTVGPIVGTGVKVYQFCALGGHSVNYNSTFLPRIGETMHSVDTLHVWRMRETLQYLESLGTDPLHIVASSCHENGLLCQFSLRMNDRHHTYKHADGSWYFPELLSPWLDEHPELLLEDRALDYTKDEVAAYRLRQVVEILDRYDVDGIDLDFTRFKPWFRPGEEVVGWPKMTALLRQLRLLTRKRGKTLSGRFEFNPQACISSGLDVETWLAEDLLDQVTLGGVGDHTPDAPSDWWIEHGHSAGCKVFPGIEGQLHWCPGSGGGGGGLHPGNGVADGFGPPSLEYMRAVAANHYRSGADGVSLFNFTCTDGPFNRAALDELAQPNDLEGKDKQYVVALWPWDAQIFYEPWQSALFLEPDQSEVAWTLQLADDFERQRSLGRAFSAVLTLEWKGLNRIGDVAVSLNDLLLTWTGHNYNHYDHGCWNDIAQYQVPVEALRQGANRLSLRRKATCPDLTGRTEVRKLVLEVQFEHKITPGALI
jgi:hypothetical protein